MSLGRRRVPAPFSAPTPSHRCRATIDDVPPQDGDGGLAALFNQTVLVKGIPSPVAGAQRSNPSPLVPPNAVVQQTMDVLQRNDYPEQDAGVTTAFHMTLPANTEEHAGSVRSWSAEEQWLTWPRFHAQLHTAYGPLLNCDSWKVASPLLFPSSRFENKAVLAVEVRSRPRPVAGTAAAAAAIAAAAARDPNAPDPTLRPYAFTFCLERQESGPCKDCWLITGVRIGNYGL